jgi:hypothetical protein
MVVVHDKGAAKFPGVTKTSEILLATGPTAATQKNMLPMVHAYCTNSKPYRASGHWPNTVLLMNSAFDYMTTRLVHPTIEKLGVVSLDGRM